MFKLNPRLGTIPTTSMFSLHMFYNSAHAYTRSLNARDVAVVWTCRQNASVCVCFKEHCACARTRPSECEVCVYVWRVCVLLNYTLCVGVYSVSCQVRDQTRNCVRPLFERDARVCWCLCKCAHIRAHTQTQVHYKSQHSMHMHRDTVRQI